MNTPRLEKLMQDMSMYDLVIDTHSHIPLKEMMPTYRECRRDIIKQYELNKGEFTTYYALSRGRNGL